MVFGAVRRPVDYMLADARTALLMTIVFYVVSYDGCKDRYVAEEAGPEKVLCSTGVV